MSLVSAIGEAVGITKNSIRGLTKFISDIRNCENKEEEEKRVNRELHKIRKQFKDNPKIDGYSRKKYVAKILYMYILGYEPDFGYTEALRLLSSKKFSEKQMGYLTLSVVLNEEHEMIPLVINSFKMDLEARPEQHICLALSAVCNIGGKTMAEALVADVERHLISQSSPSMVRKKAAMCLVRLFTRYPDLFSAEVWRDRSKEMLTEENSGVLTAYLSFFTFAANHSPSVFKSIYRTMLRLLARAVSGGSTEEHYLYYRVPNPWLSVKLLRWIQIYDVPEAEEEKKYLFELLTKLLNGSSMVAEQQSPSRNAYHMVLIEAINTAIHLQQTPELLENCSKILGGFLAEKSSNVRYLALDAFTKLAQLSTAASNMVKKHQDTVTAALQDPDISIRRRALELVYGMCDKKNCKGIVGELLTFLNYLNVNIPNDFAIREELVLKIAILAEKFASQYKWYVDVMLKLITMAGDAMSNDIWYRCIKMVTNHEDVQAYATETAYKALSEMTCNETTIKVGGFLCGEYGHLITSLASGKEQFKTLSAKLIIASEPTKAILLSSFLKLAVHFPELESDVRKLYKGFAAQFNPELQQRSVEYTQLLQLQNPDLLAKVTEALPAYSDLGDQEEVIEVKSNQKKDGNQNSAQQQSSSAVFNSPEPSSSPNSGFSPNSSMVESDDQDDQDDHDDQSGEEEAKEKKKKKKKKKNRKSVLGSGTEAVNNEFNSVVQAAMANRAPENVPQQQQQQQAIQAPQLMLAPPPAMNNQQLSPEERAIQNFKKLSLTGNGVLFENDVLQVGIKSEFQKGTGRVFIYFGNKTQGTLTNFTCSIPPTTFIGIQLAEPMPNAIEPGSQQRVGLLFQCLSPFSEASSLQLSVSFLSAGKGVHQKWELPFNLTRFLDPATIDASKFMFHWGQVKHPSNVSVDIVHALHPVNVPAISKLIQMGIRLQVLDGVDKNANNITASGVFTCTQGQSFVLLRIETNADAQMMRITLKTSNPTVTSALKSILTGALGKPAATQQQPGPSTSAQSPAK